MIRALLGPSGKVHYMPSDKTESPVTGHFILEMPDLDLRVMNDHAFRKLRYRNSWGKVTVVVLIIEC